ncbi:glycosyltransferase family protein [Candidatus Gracilibacteria bacterium]|nr:glycosyltransferase family protein [Candidatus Gracilibacteria bacterium]
MKLYNNIITTIQVRMGSTRLPGKVLKNVMDKPILLYMIERLKMSKYIDDIIIATSTNKLDDQLENFAKINNLKCYRGSEDDVLERVSETLLKFKVQIHVELCGDCVIPDPQIIDSMIEFYLKENYDVVTNSIKTTFPPGLETSIYKANLLIEQSKILTEPKYREHTALAFKEFPSKYKVKNIEAPMELYYPEIYLELDTEEDFKVIKNIYENLYPKNPDFTTLDVIDYMLKNKSIREINQNVHRRWKQYRNE